MAVYSVVYLCPEIYAVTIRIVCIHFPLFSVKWTDQSSLGWWCHIDHTGTTNSHIHLIWTAAWSCVMKPVTVFMLWNDPVPNHHFNTAFFFLFQVPKVTHTEFCQGRTMRWALAWSFYDDVMVPVSLPSASGPFKFKSVSRFCPCECLLPVLLRRVSTAAELPPQ